MLIFNQNFKRMLQNHFVWHSNKIQTKLLTTFADNTKKRKKWPQEKISDTVCDVAMKDFC